MGEVKIKNDKIIVNYCRSKSKKQRTFDLVLPYINDTEIVFTLVAEQRSSGSWKPVKAVINTEETTADEEEAANDLADLMWYIYPKKERGRKLPPIVDSWEKGDLIIAACLNERYKAKHLTAAQQEKLEWDKKSSVPDPDRLICWWPEPATWKSLKEIKKLFKTNAVKEMSVAFYTFSQYFKRPDIQKEMRKYWEELREITEDPEEFAAIGASIKTEEYARYLRRLKTTLLFFKKNDIPFNLTLGDVEQAEEFFKKERLNPLDQLSWAKAAYAFKPMPDFLVEEQILAGPCSIIGKKEKIKASLSFLSRLPGASPVPDAVGAAIYAGDKHISSTVFWFNPAATPETVDKTIEAVMQELVKRGVKEIVTIDEMLPFESFWEFEGLSLRVPDDWLNAAASRQ